MGLDFTDNGGCAEFVYRSLFAPHAGLILSCLDPNWCIKTLLVQSHQEDIVMVIFWCNSKNDHVTGPQKIYSKLDRTSDYNVVCEKR
jgi:hypothetical protein